jgi:hypothetical protein
MMALEAGFPMFQGFMKIGGRHFNAFLFRSSLRQLSLCLEPHFAGLDGF